MLHTNFRGALLAAVTVVSIPAALAMGGNPQAADEDAVLARIRPVAKLDMAAASVKRDTPRTGEELYQAVCKACHDAGVAGAPKMGDSAAWAPRIALGWDGLTKSSIAGKNAMPPKGGAADATEDEMKSAVAFMANKSGASFK